MARPTPAQQPEGTTAKKRCGRPSGAVLAWTVQQVADLLGVPEARVQRACALSPRTFFAGAFQRDGEWRIPERDVRALVGPDLPRLLKVAEFADLIGLSAQWIYELVALGTIPHRRVLGHVRIPATAYWELPEGRPPEMPARPLSFCKSPEEDEE
jgi:hypothetical protein